jgi:transcriptional regulator with XRE-family HTH domain
MTYKPQALTPGRSVRHLFGSEIRRFRENAKMSLASLSEVLNYSKSHLARIETAEAMPPPKLSEALDAAFGADGHFTRLYELAKYEVHPDKYRHFMQAEAQAVSIAAYLPHVVHGLLQTERYAEALYRICRPDLSEEEIRERVVARLSRQERLWAPGSPVVWAIVEESVIRRPLGGVAVMREQLEALIALSEVRHFTIQIMPDASGGHPLLINGPLTLLTLPDRSTVSYFEGSNAGHLVEDPEAVDQHQRAYDLLRACALSPADSAEWLKSVLEEPPYAIDPRPQRRRVAQEQPQQRRRGRVHRVRPRVPHLRPRKGQQGP